MRSTPLLRAVLALVAAAVLTAGLATATPSASADPSPTDPAAPTVERTAARIACNWRARKCWGSIAFNKATGYSGFANNRKGRLVAVRDALRKCKNRPENEGFKSDCIHPRVKNTWVRNGCLAVAFRLVDSEIVQWAKGVAFQQDAAERKAKRNLSGPGERYVSAFVCTARRG